MPDYTVKQGEDIESIAAKFHLLWETIWNDPKNKPLKDKRPDPNQLFPGDVLFVPDKTNKEESRSTGQRHRFCRKAVPSKIRLQFLDEDQPRKGLPFVLVIDGTLIKGQTDEAGIIERAVPPAAKKGKLILGQQDDQEEYQLQFNCLDPIEEISGIQGRLQNLGFDCGKVDGVLGPETKASLKEFQKKYQLDETGEIDTPTRQKILDLHGS